MTDKPNARSLPVGAVVATDNRAWIKKGNSQPHGSPFYETWWIEATTYAIQVGDLDIQKLLDASEATVLRPANPGGTS